MAITEVEDRINKMISFIESKIVQNYKSYKEEDNTMLADVNGRTLGQLMVNKTILESIKDCLKTDTDNYNCFTALDPILKQFFVNKRDWLEIFGFLLSKAKRVETDYSIIEEYYDKVGNNSYNHNIDKINDSIAQFLGESDTVESLKSKVFLSKIVSDDGHFLPYLLTNYDRFMLQAIGMDYDHVALISKECRSLYKKEHNKKPEAEEIKGTRVVNLEESMRDIKAQKAKLHYLKQFLSLDEYEIISLNPITKEEEVNIISTLEELGFKKDKIELIKARIAKFNETILNQALLMQIESLKEELFTNEMAGLYSDALTTVNDENMVYKSIKEQLAKELTYIDSLLLNCVNKVESKDDTCEYLVMAFEDLLGTLTLCGPRLIRD